MWENITQDNCFFLATSAIPFFIAELARNAKNISSIASQLAQCAFFEKNRFRFYREVFSNILHKNFRVAKEHLQLKTNPTLIPKYVALQWVFFTFCVQTESRHFLPLSWDLYPIFKSSFWSSKWLQSKGEHIKRLLLHSVPEIHIYVYIYRNSEDM